MTHQQERALRRVALPPSRPGGGLPLCWLVRRPTKNKDVTTLIPLRVGLRERRQEFDDAVETFEERAERACDVAPCCSTARHSASAARNWPTTYSGDLLTSALTVSDTVGPSTTALWCMDAPVVAESFGR